jgi:hypothetical protein
MYINSDHMAMSPLMFYLSNIGNETYNFTSGMEIFQEFCLSLLSYVDRIPV